MLSKLHTSGTCETKQEIICQLLDIFFITELRAEKVKVKVGVLSTTIFFVLILLHFDTTRLAVEKAAKALRSKDKYLCVCVLSIRSCHATSHYYIIVLLLPHCKV